MPNCRICNEPQDSRGHCKNHMECQKVKRGETQSRTNTTKKRGENRNESFDGQLHAGQTKKGGNARPQGGGRRV